jgi:ribosomal protein S18 acetylase RimI-like enzyme
MTVVQLTHAEVLEFLSAREMPPIDPVDTQQFCGGDDQSIKRFSPRAWGYRINDVPAPIGMVAAHLTRPGFYRIRGLWVDEPYRGPGLGIGKLLLRAAEDRGMRQEGALQAWDLVEERCAGIMGTFGYRPAGRHWDGRIFVVKRLDL